MVLAVPVPPALTLRPHVAIQKATLIKVFNNLGVPIATGEGKNVGQTSKMTAWHSDRQVCWSNLVSKQYIHRLAGNLGHVVDPYRVHKA